MLGVHKTDDPGRAPAAKTRSLQRQQEGLYLGAGRGVKSPVDNL